MKLFLAFPIISSLCILAQPSQSTPRNRVEFIVVDSVYHKPVPGALVELQDTSRSHSSRTLLAGALIAAPTVPFDLETWGVSTTKNPRRIVLIEGESLLPPPHPASNDARIHVSGLKYLFILIPFSCAQQSPVITKILAEATQPQRCIKNWPLI